MLFQAGAANVAAWDANHSPVGTVRLAMSHTASRASDLLHADSVGALTAGATDVKAGKPDLRAEGLMGH